MELASTIFYVLNQIRCLWLLSAFKGGDSLVVNSLFIAIPIVDYRAKILLDKLTLIPSPQGGLGFCLF